MKESLQDLPTYSLIKRYLSEPDKISPHSLEISNIIKEDLNLPVTFNLASEEGVRKLNEVLYTTKNKNEKFLNITAWIFIIWGGIGFLSSILSLTFNPAAATANILLPEANRFLDFMIRYQVLISVISILISLAMLVAFAGVLYRSEIARRIAVLVILLKIVQNFAEPLLVKYVYPGLKELNPEIPSAISSSMRQASLVMSLFVSIVCIVIYGWLIYKLTSPEIKEEFINSID